MGQKAKKVPTKSLNNSVVHEIKAEKGQHRLVLLRNGIPSASKWFEGHQIASHGKYRAVFAHFEGLPDGVFTTSPTAHEVLV
jgi:hypothetical protein